jgi:hypothetical protein
MNLAILLPMMLIGLGLGSALAYSLPQCPQSSDDVFSCDDCSESDVGTPPVGWTHSYSMTNDCRSLEAACEDCCMIIEATVGGTGAYGVIIENQATGQRVDDFTGPTFIVTMNLTSVARKSRAPTHVERWACCSSSGRSTGARLGA